MRNVTILGATGSIGMQTLAVIAQNDKQFRVFALTAHSDTEKLFQLCAQFEPQFAVLSKPDNALYAKLKTQLQTAKLQTTLLIGATALADVAQDTAVDIVVSAIVGGAGLLPTYHAAKAGKTILLANKESLIMMGEQLMDISDKHQATILPIDSEHNALFQCIPANARFRKQALTDVGINKLILTASGGPFLKTPLPELKHKTVDEACRHPNWVMGKKISVDSATMMNKGLEFIEACLLFDASPTQVDIVIHPQSTIHSVVQYRDGSSLAQMGYSDMRTPIAHALAYPNRINADVADLDLTAYSFDFLPVEAKRYPCLSLAKATVSCASSRIVLNAANEIAVEAFIAARIGFCDIYRVVDNALAQFTPHSIANIDDIIALDTQIRQKTFASLSL